MTTLSAIFASRIAAQGGSMMRSGSHVVPFQSAVMRFQLAPRAIAADSCIRATRLLHTSNPPQPLTLPPGLQCVYVCLVPLVARVAQVATTEAHRSAATAKG